MTPLTRHEYDVAVVGCGPVGALGAALLAQAGFDTLVIDRATDVYDLPRAIHFDAQIMRLLQQVGVADTFEPCVRPWLRSVFTGADGELLRVHEFPVEQIEGWAPHYLFYQPELERILRRAVVDHGADLHLGVELTGLADSNEGVTLHLEDAGGATTVEATWVVACDGAASTARKELGIPLDDMQFDEPWLVVDAEVADQDELPRDSRMVCDPVRPSTVIEGRGRHRRWEFMLRPDDDPAQIAEPAAVADLIGAWIDPSKVDIIRAAVYRFHGLVATNWRSGRTFLAGDAAHQTPPFLGQGMCHGMRDVANLTWKLAAVTAGQLGSEILDSYETERKLHVEEIIAMAVASGRDICLLDPELAAARDRTIREQVTQAALPPSPFIGMPPLRAGCLGGGDGAGFLFPQPTVDIAGSMRRLDDVAPSWSIVAGPSGDAKMTTDELDRASQLGLAVIGLVTDRDDESEHEIPGAVDPTDVVGRWMAGHHCDTALVRPDRYVYATGRDVSALIDEFAALSETAPSPSAATRS